MSSPEDRYVLVCLVCEDGNGCSVNTSPDPVGIDWQGEDGIVWSIGLVVE